MKLETREKLGYVLITALAMLALFVVMVQEPITQDPRYHLFADARDIWQIPYFWNVASNLPYLFVGLLGLYKLTRRNGLAILHDFKLAYILLFTGVSLVAFGSGYYHLAPDNSSLAWDRLPMTIGFMSFFAVVVSEFISVKIGKAILFPLLIVGVASVIYWHIGEGRGEGDLRFYALVQFTPVLLLPVILVCFRSRFTGTYGYWALMVAYILAKLCEFYDAEIYELLGVISGHSIKHVISATGIYILLASYMTRQHRQQAG